MGLENRYFDHIQLEHLIARVRHSCALNPRAVIGIGGFGGSGKSTLARRLQEALPITSVVAADDFYRPDLGHADLDRLRREVLEPLHARRAVRYQRFDWDSARMADWLDVDCSGMVIVEGVMVLSSALMSYFDFTIWADCLQEVAAERGIARDIREYGVETSSVWHSVWIPQERAYVERHRPANLADFIMST
jgi:uridine kinase